MGGQQFAQPCLLAGREGLTAYLRSPLSTAATAQPADGCGTVSTVA